MGKFIPDSRVKNQYYQTNLARKKLHINKSMHYLSAYSNVQKVHTIFFDMQELLKQIWNNSNSILSFFFSFPDPPIPWLMRILVSEKAVLCNNCISETILMFELTQNSPTSMYIS